jgi:hypothetical protein
VDLVEGPQSVSERSTKSTLVHSACLALPELQATAPNALKERDYLVRPKGSADLNR